MGDREGGRGAKEQVLISEKDKEENRSQCFKEPDMFVNRYSSNIGVNNKLHPYNIRCLQS
jgi:hypothetical protein